MLKVNIRSAWTTTRVAGEAQERDHGRQMGVVPATVPRVAGLLARSPAGGGLLQTLRKLPRFALLRFATAQLLAKSAIRLLSDQSLDPAEQCDPGLAGALPASTERRRSVCSSRPSRTPLPPGPAALHSATPPLRPAGRKPKRCRRRKPAKYWLAAAGRRPRRAAQANPRRIAPALGKPRLYGPQKLPLEALLRRPPCRECYRRRPRQDNISSPLRRRESP